MYDAIFTPADLYALINLPDPVREMYTQLDASCRSSPSPDLVTRLLCRETWNQAVKELEAAIGDDPGHLILLWEELRIAAAQWPKWREKGIPTGIYRDTMRFATRYLNDGLKAYGQYCFMAGWWFPRQLAMALFRLGQFEFELVPHAEGKRIYLHIPSDASLSDEALTDSLNRFKTFTHTFYPEWEACDIYCDSWLLSPALKQLLPPASRILTFQNRFGLLSVDEDNMGALEWVFPGFDKVSEALPEQTSLQRRMKAFLLEGHKPGWAEGRLMM